MNIFLWIISLIFGLFIGTAVSLSIFSKRLDKSNNIGDSTSTFDDVCAGRVQFTHRSTYDSTEYKAQFFRDHGYASYDRQGIKTDNFEQLDDNAIPEDLPEVDIPLFKPLT
ncbi:MAG: hypothetical protein K6F49_11885 [Saccharofermentans sp.]|nr:hypothetical protein [Saccharofermentans sp.]